MKKRSCRSVYFKLFFLIAVVSASMIFLFSCSGDHVHEWGEWKPYIEPTCYVVGQEKSTCSCGAVRYRELTLKHDFVFDRNDIETGSKVYVCTVCGKENSDEKLTAADIGMPVLSFDVPLADVGTGKTECSAKFEDENIPETGFDAVISAPDRKKASDPADRLVIEPANEDGAGSIPSGIAPSGGGITLVSYRAFENRPYDRSLSFEKLYFEAVEERGKNDPLVRIDAWNNNAGFPVSVYFDGTFSGVYLIDSFETSEEIHVPETLSAIRFTADTGSAQLREHLTDDEEAGGYEILHLAPGADPEALRASFNAMIDFIAAADGEFFAGAIGGYTDVDRAIDTMLMTCAAAADPNVSSGIMWISEDGTKWIPIPSSFDAAWGADENGELTVTSGSVMPGDVSNALYEKLSLYLSAEIKDRWEKLRAGVLSLDNIEKSFSPKLPDVPEAVMELENNLFPAKERTPNENEAAMQFVNSNIYLLDTYFREMN